MQKTHKGALKFIPAIDEEVKKVEEAKEFLRKELNLEIVTDVNASYDPKGTRKFALPLKPAIYLE